MRRGLACCIAVALLAPALARAEEPPPHQRLDEVVVTGSKLETPAWDATVPTQVVPRERIEDTATIDVENVLGEIPGLYVRKNELFGLGASTVRMQGADPNKVAILVDGRRFRGGIDGIVDLRDIPANNIERVEVIRGPASSLYGSDAMAGVINIITRQGTKEPTGEAVGALGSFHRKFAAASHGWSKGPVRWFLSGLRDEFRLFEQYGDVSAQYSGANQKETQNRDQVGLRLDADLAPRHGITLFPSYQQQKDPTSHNRNNTLGGEWRWDTSETSRLTSWVNRYGFDRRNDLVGFQEDSEYADYEAESRWTTQLPPTRAWEGNFVTLGTRGRIQTLDQTTLEVVGAGSSFQPHVKESVWQVSPFLQTDALVSEQWSFLLGSSFDWHEGYGLDVNPRFTATYRPWPIFRLSATVGRGFRAPDLTQLYALDVNAGGLYALVGNPDLEPETDLAYQLEAGIRTTGVDAFLTLFRHDFEDLIGFAQVPVCTAPGRPPGCIVDPLPDLPGGLRFQTRNFAEAVTQGLELGMDFSVLELLGRPSAHEVTAGLGYAFLDTENKSGIPGEDGNDLPFRPHHRVLPSLGWRHRDLGTALRIWGEYESDAYTDVANSPDLVARNHWLWNFKVTLSPFHLLPDDGSRAFAQTVGIGRHFRLFVQGENVFDQEYGPLTTSGRLAGPAAYLFGISAGL
jgi:outer membrane receptor for ferrienterochelin and colicins